MCKEYPFNPVCEDLSGIVLDDKLAILSEIMAESSHEAWAEDRIRNGWRYGDIRDNSNKLHPSLVPYSELPRSEKDYDIRASVDILKLITKRGFVIRKIEN